MSIIEFGEESKAKVWEKRRMDIIADVDKVKRTVLLIQNINWDKVKSWDFLDRMLVLITETYSGICFVPVMLAGELTALSKEDPTGLSAASRFYNNQLRELARYISPEITADLHRFVENYRIKLLELRRKATPETQEIPKKLPEPLTDPN